MQEVNSDPICLGKRTRAYTHGKQNDHKQKLIQDPWMGGREVMGVGVLRDVGRRGPVRRENGVGVVTSVGTEVISWRRDSNRSWNKGVS